MFSSAKKATAIDWIRFLLAALIGVAIVTFATAGASQPADPPRFDGIHPPAGQENIAMSVKKRPKVEQPKKRPDGTSRRGYQLKDAVPEPRERQQRTPQWYDGLWDDQRIQFMLRTVA